MKIIAPLLLLLACQFSNAQVEKNFSTIDTSRKYSLSVKDDLNEIKSERSKVKSLIFPSVLVAYGFIALETKPIRKFDYSMESEIIEDHPTFHTPIDNFSQYAPAVAVYVLNAAGVKGKHDLIDRTMIYLLSNIIAGTAVQSIKTITHEPRPNGGQNSFPSGHTTTAFVSAEFLRQEYKDVSPWYGIAGYTVAAATGVLRMYNRAHWFRDIVPGAGFGILSTRIAYWIYPSIKRKIFPHKSAMTLIMPTYGPTGFGVSAACVVKL
jgi:PAP2 superfamily